jgi:calpain-15
VHIKDIIPGYQIISKSIKPTDIYQGNLSNCYLLSALSALAENPSRVLRILPQTSMNKRHIYSVLLCKTGIFEEILLDGYFPAKHGKKFKFCHTRNEDIWPMLVEKAYSKIFGAYWNTGLGGCAVNALKDLTGMPSEIFKLSNVKYEDIWQKTKESLDRGYVVIASSKSDNSMTKKGLASWHAYTVLSLIVDSGRHLIKLRNPWGKGVWISEDSQLVKINSQFKDAENAGVFVMPFEELLINFEELSICHYEENYVYTQKRHKYTDNDIFPFQVVIETAGDYYISISKPDKRYLWSCSPDSFISAVMVKVAIDKTATYAGGVGGIHRDPFFKTRLTAGTYVAYVDRL